MKIYVYTISLLMCMGLSHSIRISGTLHNSLTKKIIVEIKTSFISDGCKIISMCRTV